MGDPEVASITHGTHVTTRGRPVGKTYSTLRTRRAAQEISDDKIRIAQMKLDALRGSEERKLANKKTRARTARAVVEETAIPTARRKKVVVRDESPEDMPKPKIPVESRKQQLYNSWFTRY